MIVYLRCSDAFTVSAFSKQLDNHRNQLIQVLHDFVSFTLLVLPLHLVKYLFFEMWMVFKLFFWMDFLVSAVGVDTQLGYCSGGSFLPCCWYIWYEYSLWVEWKSWRGLHMGMQNIKPSLVYLLWYLRMLKNQFDARTENRLQITPHSLLSQIFDWSCSNLMARCCTSGGRDYDNCLLGGVHRRLRLRTLQAPHWNLSFVPEQATRMLLYHHSLFTTHYESLVATCFKGSILFQFLRSIDFISRI